MIESLWFSYQHLKTVTVSVTIKTVWSRDERTRTFLRTWVHKRRKSASDLKFTWIIGIPSIRSFISCSSQCIQWNYLHPWIRDPGATDHPIEITWNILQAGRRSDDPISWSRWAEWRRIYKLTFLMISRSWFFDQMGSLMMQKVNLISEFRKKAFSFYLTVNWPH